MRSLKSNLRSWPGAELDVLSLTSPPGADAVRPGSRFCAVQPAGRTTVAVTVRIAGIADAVVIDIALRRIGNGRAVIGTGAKGARGAGVADAVEVRVDLRL